MSDKDCNTCAWAAWDNGDSSVGMPAHVDDCKATFYSIETHIERIGDDEDYECPLHCEKHPAEWERTRCTKCNSPNTKPCATPEQYAKLVKDYKNKSVCNDCGAEFIHDIGMW